jgi:hypothetical protein
MWLRCLQVRFARLTSVTLCMCVLLAVFGMGVPAARAESPSFVRIIHASPFVGTADVFVDGSKLLSSFAFGAVTGYASIPPGPHKVQIALVGKGINAAALNQTLTVSPGVAYTVAAIGASASSLSLEVFVDNNLGSPSSAKLRVYQLSPNTGPISVAAGSNTLASGIAYQQASDYLSLAAGSYTFDVNASQVNSSLSLATTLKADTVTSIFTVGMFNGNPKLSLVSAQVNALPGLPGTGSDPNAPPLQNTQSSVSWLPWLLGALLLVCIGAVVMTRRRTVGD